MLGDWRRNSEGDCANLLSVTFRQANQIANQKLFKFDQSRKGKGAEPKMDGLSLALKIW